MEVGLHVAAGVRPKCGDKSSLIGSVFRSPWRSIRSRSVRLHAASHPHPRHTCDVLELLARLDQEAARGHLYRHPVAVARPDMKPCRRREQE